MLYEVITQDTMVETWWVQSDVFAVDTDKDGLSDLKEFELAVARQVGMKGLDHVPLIIFADELEIAERQADLGPRTGWYTIRDNEELTDLAQL